MTYFRDDNRESFTVQDARFERNFWRERIVSRGDRETLRVEIGKKLPRDSITTIEEL